MSDYTGQVRVGGPADIRQLDELEIIKVAVGPMNNNAYLLRCARSLEVLLIDAADEADRLLELTAGSALRTVVTTHRHADHWQALAAIARASGAATVTHPLDASSLPVTPQRLVVDGDAVAVGEVLLRVIHLRGHTPGSIALRYDDPTGRTHLFTGDSLFPGGVGNTGGDAQNFATLLQDVTSKLFDVLPDSTWVYPGHGADTTLGDERPALPQWRARGW